MPEFISRKENIYRGLVEPPRMTHEKRSDGSDAPVLHGHFAKFDTWTEIRSWYEGDFLESLSRGAFAKTISESIDNMRVQFDHGYDSHVGNAPLGPIDTLMEDDEGAYYEVPLLDTDYNRDRILPLLEGRLMGGDRRGSMLGASFRFNVVKEDWDDKPGRSDRNPDGLPERTIKEVRLMEFGPVVFPAYSDATAKVRCMTDFYLDRDREKRSASPSPADLAATGKGEPSEPTNSGHSDEQVTKPGRSISVAKAQIHKVARRL